MTSVTLVTGPLCSGTSCVTGLLELCGFDLGRRVRILRNPTDYNPKGHFEPDLLVTISEPDANGLCGAMGSIRNSQEVILENN